jgi:protein-disulfide isomerase
MAESKFWRALEKASTLAVLVVAAVVLARAAWPGEPESGSPGRRPFVLPEKPVSIEGAERLGSPTARLAMIVFSDFECPFCGKFAKETWPLLRAEFVDSGKMVVVFRNLPLPIHASASNAAIAALCAGREGRFWPMHDLIFRDRSKLSDSDLANAAKEAGLC